MSDGLLRRPSLRGLGAVLLATVVFCWPLLTQPALPSGSDSSYHSQWAHGFVEGLGEGIVYPRWVGDVNRGFGAPVFLIYPPLGYYGVAAAYLFTGDVLEAIRLVLVAAAFLSGLAFYFAARGRFSELGAAVGAALYILLPYHGLDLYDRFALAEYCAFPWIPLLFLGVRRLATRPCWTGWFLLAGSYAGLLFTHLMSGYLVLFVLGPYALVLLLRSRRWTALGPMAAAGLAGVLCASVYVLPFVVNRHRVHTDWFDTPHYDWHRNFIYRDEVAFGFKRDIVKPWAERSANTQTILAAAAAGLLWLRRRRPVVGPPAEALAEGWLHAALALWALYLQTPLATPLWATVPQLGAAQFPWRFSALQMLCAAFLSAAALSAAEPPPEPAPATGKKRRPGKSGVRPAGPAGPEAGLGRWPAWPLRRRPGWTAAALLVAALPAFWVTAKVTGARPYDFTTAKARHPVYRYRVVKEFFPQGVEGWLDWDKVPFPEGSGVSLSGPGQVSGLEWSAQARRLHVEAPAPVRAVFRTFDYPGWQASVDGAPVPIHADSPSRVIEVEVPAGAHEVEITFRPTWDRQLGAALSACGLALILALVVYARRQNTRQKAG